MKSLLIVGAGGFVGSVARYALSVWAAQLTPHARFPFGTFTVNVLGCLAAGVLTGLAEKHEMFGPETRLLLFTGLLGGFTTFSAFGLETLSLLRRGELSVAAVYVVASIVLGLVTAWLGMRTISVWS